MAKVVVKNNFDESMRIFSHITSETRKDAKKHEYYLRPGLRRLEKSKEAMKTKAKARKRFIKKAI
ncbi:MAG: 30S ribosomal protein S21 [Mycoplasmataceae bacterium]|jgi:small subunit ribosomal protein S21|nr:30S ribosomal protein S21 [Mycoplasmataceae bacterium]